MKKLLLFTFVISSFVLTACGLFKEDEKVAGLKALDSQQLSQIDSNIQSSKTTEERLKVLDELLVYTETNFSNAISELQDDDRSKVRINGAKNLKELASRIYTIRSHAWDLSTDPEVTDKATKVYLDISAHIGKAVVALDNARSDKDKTVRLHVVSAIGPFAQDAIYLAKSLIEETMNDEEPTVRSVVMITLGYIAITAHKKMAEYERASDEALDIEERTRAMKNSEEMKDNIEVIVAQLINAVQDKEEHEDARKVAAVVLGSLGKGAAEALRPLKDIWYDSDENRDMRDEAEKAYDDIKKAVDRE